MKNKFKLNKDIKTLMIVASILIIGVLLVYFGNSLASTDTTILRKQVVEGLTFDNASLEYLNEISTFKVEVTNTNTSTYNLKYININFEDEDGLVTTLIGYIGDSIEDGVTKEITASIDKDITNSVSLDYSIVK